MLQRRTANRDLVYYASPLLERLGVPHAFSTRRGGVSHGPFESLNLGNPTGAGLQDSAEHLADNYQRLHDAIGVAQRQRCWVHQVHGERVAVVRNAQAFESGDDADALLCDDPRRVVAVRTADCVPILAASDDGAVVAAIHAGWRGVVAGVVPAAVGALCRQWGIKPARLTLAVGPCIGADAYEVGADVLEQFVCDFPATAAGAEAPIQRRVGDRGLLDLRRAVHRQLLASGIPAHQIDETDRCTYLHADEFFSHRRDNGITGRMAAIIGPRG
jgi:YfiH family protein